MAYFRLIAFFYFLLYSFFTFAATEPPVLRYPLSGVLYETSTLWCDAKFKELQTSATTYTVTRGDCLTDATLNVTLQYTESRRSGVQTTSMSSQYFCSNKILIGFAVNKNTVCTVPDLPTCTAGEVVMSGTLDYPSPFQNTPTLCKDSCEVGVLGAGSPYIDCSYNSSIGICSSQVDITIKKTGNTCSGTLGNYTVPTPTTLPPKPNPCPVCDCLKAGKSWGTVNGTTVCVTAGSAGSNPVKFANLPTKTTDSSGNTTINNNNTTIEISNSSSTSISGSSGTNTGGSGSSAGQTSTASVKVTNPDGSSTTTPMNQYCQQNPNNPMCKSANNGTFSGSCSTGFSCDGDDAIKCAIAQKIYRDRCDDLADTPQSTLGKKILAGTDTSFDPLSKSNAKVINVDSSSLDLSGGSVGEGSCPLDKTVSLLGRSITLPISQVCEPLTWMGRIVLAFAFFIAFRIVSSSFENS